VFEEPLLPLGSAAPSPDENRELAGLLSAYLTAGVPDGTSDLEEFASRHVDSPWRASLLTNLGVAWRRTGHFSKAYNAWELAWESAKDLGDQRGHAVADKALGEYMALNSRLGRFDVLQKLLEEIRGRDIHGSAWEQVSNARAGVVADEQRARAFVSMRTTWPGRGPGGWREQLQDTAEDSSVPLN